MMRFAKGAIDDVLVTRGGVLAACNAASFAFLPLLDDEWADPA